MSSEPQKSETHLRAVHQCKHCGHFAARENLPEVSIISGVFECPQCGEAGALNVVIIEKGDGRDIEDATTQPES